MEDQGTVGDTPMTTMIGEATETKVKKVLKVVTAAAVAGD